MERYFYFLDGSRTLALPVTPKSFTWEQGITVETVNISQTGDVHLPCNEIRYSGKIECMFPANPYSWLAPGAVTQPYSYVSQFAGWSQAKKPVRFLVAGGAVNSLVLVESIQYREQDGSGDVYAAITLREYVELEARESAWLDTSGGGVSGNGGQSAAGGTEQTYTVQAGDMLSLICRRFYGDGSASYYNALARYNGIPNPHLIYPGTVLRLPGASALFQ
ncbi:MAG: LysM peptidoglycan-binding domain-containing protein [Oscillospiraceae bacterium]|nr:LysM peptidoglycan-binding domain-containing protein [Oscillospiraceae bacterium]